MSIIKQKGVPTRNTKGSIGDIYVDLNTGNRYQCTFAYISAGSVECDWKPVSKGTVTRAEISDIKTPVVLEPAVEEVKEELVEEVSESTAEEPIKPARQSQRTNYTQYSKKSK